MDSFSNTDFDLRSVALRRYSSDSVKIEFVENVHDVGGDVFRGPSSGAAARHPLSDASDLVSTRRW